MAPKVVLIFHNSTIRLLESTYIELHKRYGDDVLILHSSGPTEIEVYGADKGEGDTIAKLVEDLIDQLSVNEQQVIYEKLNSLGRRMK